MAEQISPSSAAPGQAAGTAVVRESDHLLQPGVIAGQEIGDPSTQGQELPSGATDQAALPPGALREELRQGPQPEIAGPEEASPDRIVFAGLGENIRGRAVDASYNMLNERLSDPSGNRMTRFLRRVWHGSFSREYQITKNRNVAENRIVDEQNLGVYDGLTPDQYRSQTLRRFEYEFDNTVGRQDLIHEEAGERHESLVTLANQGDEQAIGLRNDIYSLVDDYVNNRVDIDSFREREARMMNDQAQDGTTREIIGDARIYVSNLQRIADHIKAAVTRDGTSSSAQMLDRMDIVIGQARLGARHRHEQTATERIYEAADRLGATRSILVNEATISAGVSAAAYAVKRGASAGLAAAMFPIAWVAPGLAAGAFAGAREARALRGERIQHEREMAEGKLDPANLEGRRTRLEETRYNTRSMVDLTNELGGFYSANVVTDADGNRALGGNINISTDDELQNAYALIGDIRARIQLSDREDINLLAFTDVAAAISGNERTDLDVALATAECAVRRLVNDPAFLAGQPSPNADRMRRQGFDNALDERINFAVGGLGGNIDASDARYRKIRNEAVTHAVLKGTALGIGIGALSLGLEAGVHELAGSSLVGGLEGHLNSTKNMTEMSLGHHSTLKLPDGLHGNIDGRTLNITGPAGFEPIHATLTPDGSLSESARAAFAHDHLHLASSHSLIRETASETHHGVSANQLVRDHIKDTERVRRDYWYNNDTPTSNLNELKMDWNGTGVTPNGGISFNISSMTPGGSFDGARTVDALQAARHGDIRLLVSASKNTQGHPFAFKYHRDGVVDIPKGSPARHLFSVRNVDGHQEVQFNGAYAETVQDLGTHGGVTDVAPLATVVGNEHATFTNVVHINRMAPVNHYSVTYNQAAPVNPPLDLFPFSFSVVDRDGLTPVPQRQEPAPQPPDTQPPADTAPLTPTPPADNVAGERRPATPPGADDETEVISDGGGRGQPADRGAVPLRPTREQFQSAMDDPNAPDVANSIEFFNARSEALAGYSDDTKRQANRILNLARDETANAFNRPANSVLTDPNMLTEVFRIAQREVLRLGNRNRQATFEQQRQGIEVTALINFLWQELSRAGAAGQPQTATPPNAGQDDDQAQAA